MAFTRSGFRVVAFGGSVSASTRPIQICSYVSNEALATIVADNYFDPLVNEVAVGDQIMISADLDGTPATQTVMVEFNDGTHVKVATPPDAT